MENGLFYKNVKCIFTNEGKKIFAEQSNGPKLAKVGAILFSDYNKIIKKEYATDPDLKILEKLTLKHMLKYTTLIYKKVSYTLDNGIYTPDNKEAYNNAFYNEEKLLPVHIAYSQDLIEEADIEETYYDKYMSYDFILGTKDLTINKTTNADFDGIILVSLPHKPTEEDKNIDFVYKQSFSSLAYIYFPDDNEKIQIVLNQLDNVKFNVETHIRIDKPIKLDNIPYVNMDEQELEKPQRFINGLHLVNDGLHDRR